MKHYFVCAGSLLLFACGGSALDVGSNQGGSSSSAGGGTDSGASSGTAFGGTATAGAGPGEMAGRSAGGSFAKGGATMALGGQAMGARSGSGGQMVGADGQMVGAGGQLKGADGQGQAAGGTMAASGGPSMGASGSPSSALLAQTCASQVSQIWEGSTLDFFFNPQDDRWRINFDGAGPNGRVCGTATYLAAGEAPPPPATDPDAAYPASWDPNTGMGDSSPFPGVTYSIIQGAEVGGVLHFRIATTELWQGWCALQTPEPHAEGYSCIGGDGGWSSDGVTCTVVNSDGTTKEYPYAKCMLCSASGVCACDATRCVARDGGSVVFDLKVDGKQMTGTVGSTMIIFDQGM